MCLSLLSAAIEGSDWGGGECTEWQMMFLIGGHCSGTPWAALNSSGGGKLKRP